MTEYINKEFYKEIPPQERYYINLNANSINAVMDRLNAEGILFSATLNNYKNVVTVHKADSERAAAIVGETSPRRNTEFRIIGNTDYRSISDKRYIKMDTDTALKVTAVLSGDNSSRFSGRIIGDNATITVSGDKNAANVRRMADNIKNSDLLTILDEAGFERVNLNNGFVNFRNSITGAVEGFDNLDMVREMFEDKDNEFFNPTAYRIELTSDAFEDAYYISCYDNSTGEEKTPYYDSDGMPTFHTVEEAINYVESKNIPITNSNDELNVWEAAEADLESEKISEENRSHIADFPMQNGLYPDHFRYNEADNSFIWTFFNPDGDNGNGEFVEKYISEQDIYAAYMARANEENEADGRNAFITCILENCREAVIDTYSGYFQGYADEYINKPDSAAEFYGIGENSIYTEDMTALITLLEENCPSAAADKDRQAENKSRPLDLHSDEIEIEGYTGTWYVVDVQRVKDRDLFLLESEIYGDEAACLIVDESRNVVMDNVHNGFADYLEANNVPEGQMTISGEVASEMWYYGFDVHINGEKLAPFESVSDKNGTFGEIENKDNTVSAPVNDVTLYHTADTIASAVFDISEKYFNAEKAVGVPYYLNLERYYEDNEWNNWRSDENEYANAMFSLLERNFAPVENYLISVVNESKNKDDMAEDREKALKALQTVDVFKAGMEEYRPIPKENEPIENNRLHFEPVEEKSYAEQLYERVNDEYSYFIGQMKKESPEVLIESAAEIVDKDRIRLYLEEYEPNLSDEQYEALLSRNNPLDEIYEQWVKNGELHSIEDVAIVLEETADRILISLEREQPSKKNTEQEKINMVLAVSQHDTNRYYIANEVSEEAVRNVISNSDRLFMNLCALGGKQISEVEFAEYSQRDGVEAIDVNIDEQTMHVYNAEKPIIPFDEIKGTDEIASFLDLDNNTISFSVITIEDEKPFVVGDYIDKYDITALEEYQDYIYDTGKTETDVKVEYYQIGGGDNESYGAYDDERTFISEHLDEVLAHRLTDNLESEAYSVTTPAELLDEINEEKGIAEEEIKEKSELDSAIEYISKYVAKEFDLDGSSTVPEDLKHVSLGYTELGDNAEYAFQVEVDLEDYAVRYYIENELVREDKYNTLTELIERELSSLEFDYFVSEGNDLLEEYLQKKSEEQSKTIETSEQKNTEKLPLYTKDYNEAKAAGETELFIANLNENRACARAIDNAINGNYSDNRLNSAAALESVMQNYGFDRIMHVVSARLYHNDWDRRITDDNTTWAKAQFENISADSRRMAQQYQLNAHPGLINLFADTVREEEKRIHSLEQSANELEEEADNDRFYTDDRPVREEFSSFNSPTTGMIDHILRCGSNEPGSLERIVRQFQKNKSVEENAEFLKNEFGEDGRGYIYNNNGEYNVSAWFDESGVYAAVSETAFPNGRRSHISWESAAEYIRKMLDNGTFCSQDVIDRARDIDIKDIADKLWYLHQDSSIPFFIPDYFFKGGFSESTEKIAEALHGITPVNEFTEGLSKFYEQYLNDHDVLRFKFHKIPELLDRMKDLQSEYSPARVRFEYPQYKTKPDFKPEYRFFITEDEIDKLLLNGSSTSGGKFRIEEFFKQEHTAKEKADFLKNEYGTGGSGRSNYNESHDSKGIELQKGRDDTVCEVKINWNEAAKRIDRLISAGKYISEKDIQRHISNALYDLEHRDINLSYERPIIERAMAVLDKYNVPYEKPQRDPVDVLSEKFTEHQMGKFEIEAYYQSFSPSIEQLAEYIRGQFENQKQGFGLKDYAAGPNGIVFTDLTEYSWEQVAEAVAKAIDDGKYISAEERAENDNTPKYSIYQIPAGERYRDIRFTNFDHLQIMGQLPDRMNYEKVYSGRLEDIDYTDKLEGIFVKFNVERPEDFEGRSLSVSDVVVIEDENGKSANFVDDVGFKDITDIFFEHERKEQTVEQLNINDYENIRLVSRSEWDDHTLGDDENPAFEEISVSYTPDEDGSFTKYAHNTTNSSLVDVWDEENSVSADDLLEDIANHLKKMGQDRSNRSYHIELTDYDGNSRKLDSNNISFVLEDKQREQSEMAAPDVEFEKSVEEGIIGSMGYPIDEMDKAFEAENSRTDYSNEAEPARKKSGSEIEIGDRFLYNDREYTVTSEKGIYTNDVGVSYKEKTGGVSYVTTQNIDRYKLAEKGVFLGNPEKEAIQPAAENETTPNVYEPKIGDVIEYQDALFTIANVESGNVTLMTMDTLIPDTEVVPVTDLITSESFFVVEENGEPVSEKKTVPSTEKAEENKPKTQNFVIDDDNFGVAGGAKTRYADNIEAIKTLKMIEAENRTATPEEQKILSKYTGWGAIPQAFDINNDKWRTEYAEFRTLLTPDEYAAARKSTMNAHYTSPTVISAIYDGLKNLGFEKGKILEPAVGIGNFFGVIPEEMRSSKLFGVELDSLTGRIAQQLYPNADIQIKGFEETSFADNSFDAAIGNVPFGDYKLNDRRYNDNNFLIHDYFFAKALDKVHPGGVIAFVTSKGTLDKENPEVRKYLAQRAELLGAIRLPNNAFKANAGAEVTSDIIFLQKRERPIEINPDEIEWLNKSETPEGFSVNNYFVQHPEMVLGTIAEAKQIYGPTENTQVLPIEGADLKQQLSEAIKNIQGQYRAAEKETVPQNVDEIPAPANSRKYSLYAVDGNLYFREAEDTMKKVNVSKDVLNRAIGMIELRDNVRELLNMQLNNSDGTLDGDIAESRENLNKAYDSFVAKYGNVSDCKNAKAMQGDDGYNIVSALEVKDEKGKVMGKADIFTHNTVKPKTVASHVDTAEEALILSVAEKAKVDFDYMTALCGMEKDKLISELSGQIFRLPQEEEKYVTADEYLTGNIRKKLRELENAPENMDVSENRTALEAAMPPRVEAKDISVKLGAHWVDPKYIADFIKEKFNPDYDTRRRMSVQYSAVAGAWKIENVKANAKRNYYSTNTYGTHRKNAYELIEAILNNGDIQVKDRVKDEYGNDMRDQNGKYILVINDEETKAARRCANVIKSEFQDWIFKDPERREALVQKYNEVYNSIRHREYDGSHLNFSGMNTDITLKEHQKNAIARGLYGGNSLLAHAVGAGKTFEMIAIAMEGKRLGLHNKCLFAVPNALTEQMGNDFRRLYPNANILVATQKDFEKANRLQLFGKIAANDWDAVIVGHSQFDRMGLSPEKEKAYLTDEVEKLRYELEMAAADSEGGKKSFTVKQIEKSIANYEDKLEKLNDAQTKDGFIDFEQLGFDKVFVDESHMYKNLATATKMHNVSGLGTQGSARAFNLLMKSKYLDEITGGRGLTFASGTPIITGYQRSKAPILRCLSK